MPLMNDDDIPEVNKEDDHELQVIETSTVYEGKTTDTETPVYLTEIEGTPWTNRWYGQILGADDYPNRLDANLHPSLQQYVRINNNVIKYTEALSLDTDDNVISTLSGSANVYPGNVPNQWDMFTATMKDGRVGLFTVTELPKAATYLAYTAYQIEYELVCLLTDELQYDLDRKVVSELYFDPNNPTCPTANLTERVERADVIKAILRLVHMYYDYFYDKRNRTFLSKTEEGGKLYDDNIVAFLNSIIPLELREATRHPRADRFATPSTSYLQKSRTILDILLDGELTMWDIMDIHYTMPETHEFYSSFVMHGILLTDISRAIHPFMENTLAGSGGESKGTYIFSEEFYAGETTNPFELMVMSLIKSEQIDFGGMCELIEIKLKDSDLTELYHIIPIAIWMNVKLL